MYLYAYNCFIKLCPVYFRNNNIYKDFKRGDIIKSYLNTILTVSLVGGIINALAPNGSGIKKYVGYIISLACILTIISPLSSVVSTTSSLKESVSSFVDKIFVSDDINNANDLIINSGKESVENGIKEAIITKYGFDNNDVIVELILNQEEIDQIKIKSVLVTLTGKASWSDAKPIKEYLNNLIGTEIEVKRK